MWQYNNANELYHYGIKGMRWGVRRYANKNGKLNAEGRRRYGVNSVQDWKKRKKEMSSAYNKLYSKTSKRYDLDKYESYANTERKVNRQRREITKKLFGDNVEPLVETYANDIYKERRSKAEAYVDKRMKKDFGVSYDAWTKEKDTRDAIILGTTMMAALGYMAYRGVKTMKGRSHV